MLSRAMTWVDVSMHQGWLQYEKNREQRRVLWVDEM
jgi:hypothetical protein